MEFRNAFTHKVESGRKSLDLPGAKILDCPECDGKMFLRQSKHGPFYGCENFPTCRAAHGAHPNGEPLGVPANAETKKWRIRAHDGFDHIWKHGEVRRNDAYSALAQYMSISRDECHIGSFDIEQCEEVLNFCDWYPPDEPDHDDPWGSDPYS